MKHKLKEFMKNKEVVSLKEIYAAFPDIKQYSIRATLNAGVKKGDFKRVDKGKYKEVTENVRKKEKN